MYGGKLPAAPSYREETERMRMREEASRAKDAAKLARREAFDSWNLREKAGPAGVEAFYDRGPEKRTAVVPFSDKLPYHGAERAELVRAAKLGVRPREAAGAEKLRAEAGEIKYGTEFKRDLEDVLKGIVTAEGRQAVTAAEEAELGFSEAERGVSRRDIAEEEARLGAETGAEIRAEEEARAKAEAARPGRRMQPGLKRALWEGTPTKFGTLPGLGAPLYGYKNIADWLREGMKKGYEYAFPQR